MLEWQNRPQKLVGEFIRKQLKSSNGGLATCLEEDESLQASSETVAYEDGVIRNLKDRFRSDSFNLGLK